MIDLKPILPASLSAYTDPIEHALECFLTQLPGHEGYRFDVESIQVGEAADWIHLALRSPTLHKLAQVLARHRGLPTELRTGLQTLESLLPRTPVSELSDILREELGERLAEIELADAPLAEGSVAVVVPFTWKTPTEGRSSRGVLKVLRPGVRERLEAELDAWSHGARIFGERCRAIGLPSANHAETFDTVAELLRHEVDFAAEQRNLSVAATAPRGVRIPRLLPFCSPSITAMERIDGIKVTEAPLSHGAAHSMAGRVVEALVTRTLWSTDSNALFHADPHAGNLAVTADGELVLYDWALIGRLSDSNREHMTQVLLSAVLGDFGGVYRAIEALCVEAVSAPAALRTAIECSLGSVGRGPLKPLTWLATLLDRAAMEGGARFPADLLLFRKALLILDGVVADMAGEGTLDRFISSSAYWQLAAEWPARMFLPPGSRRIGSRLSSLDLLRAAFNFPLAAASRIGTRSSQLSR